MSWNEGTIFVTVDVMPSYSSPYSIPSSPLTIATSFQIGEIEHILWESMAIYPVHCAKLTLIQPTWSANPYHLVSLYGICISLFSLYGIHIPLFLYMVTQFIVMVVALLWAAMDSPLSQGPLLWRHHDMTIIGLRNMHGRERDTWQRLDNTNAWQLKTFNW